MKIVPFEQSDLDRIMKIELVSFTAPWSRQSYIDMASLANIHFFVAKISGELVGYMLYQMWANETELHTIAVAPDKRRKGIGKMLFEYFLNDARSNGVKQAYLQARVSNIAARTLYEKHGFVAIGVRKKYYADNGEDALVMQLDL